MNKKLISFGFIVIFLIISIPSVEAISWWDDLTDWMKDLLNSIGWGTSEIEITGTEYIKGTISHTGNNIKIGNRKYTIGEAITFKEDKDRYYLTTVDGLECNFNWDDPTDKIEITSTIIDFKQGRFSDIKCNQEYSQDGDILTFASGWIIDIDPNIHHTGGDFTGTYNQTTTDTENITLNKTDWGSYTGTSYKISDTGPTDLYWNGSDWFIMGTNKDQILQYNEDFTSNPTNYSVLAQDSLPFGISWNESNWFMVGQTNTNVYLYDSNWSYLSVSWDIGGQETNPRDIAWNGSNWFMVGTGSQTVHEYDSDWVATGNNWSVAGQDSSPQGIYWDGLNWWLAGNNGQSIYKYDSNWSYMQSFNVASEDTGPNGIFNNGNNWYMVGGANDKVYKYNLGYVSSGTYTSQVIDASAESQWDYLNWSQELGSYWNDTGSFGLVGAGSDAPRGITFDTRDNSFWVVDYTDNFVYHFDSNGNNISGGFGTTVAGTEAYGIAFDSTDNSFWVTHGAPTNYFVYHFDSNGNNISGGFDATVAGSDFPVGITIDTRDNSFWVLDITDTFIYHFDSNGVNTSGGFNTAGAGGTSIRGIAFDSSDNSFWVADNTAIFVYHFDSNGNSISGGFDIIGGASGIFGIAFDTRDDSLWIADGTADSVYHFSEPSIKFQARSCDDIDCVGETFIGPANTTDTYFTENVSLNTTLTPNNRYFQYKAWFETSNTSATPYLMSVDIGYTSLDEAPTFFGSSFLPSPAYSNSTLNASIGCKDAENDSDMYINISWWRDGETNISFYGPYANGSYNSWYLPARELLDNQEDGIFNMTGNVLLMHFNSNFTDVYNETLDTSGNNNNGSVIDNVNMPLFTDGKLNKAFEFDGVDDYINIGQKFTTETEFTVSLWANKREEKAQWIFSNYIGATDRFGILGNGNAFFIFDDINNNGTSFGSTSVDLNQWYHLVATCNSSGKEFYIDGVLKGTHNSGACFDQLPIGITMLATKDDDSEFFNGTIDEVAIWNRILLASEIKNIYDMQRFGYTDAITRGQTWGVNATCFDGTQTSSTNIGSINISNLPPYFSPALGIVEAMSGNETNHTVTCDSLDSASFTYSDNVTGDPAQTYYSNLSTAGEFSWRPSWWEYINFEPYLNVNVSCQDDYGATGEDNLQINISAPYGAGNGGAGTCDLGCLLIEDGCAAYQEGDCTILR